MRLVDWLWEPIDVLGNGGMYAARWVYWLVVAAYVVLAPVILIWALVAKIMPRRR